MRNSFYGDGLEAKGTTLAHGISWELNLPDLSLLVSAAERARRHGRKFVPDTLLPLKVRSTKASEPNAAGNVYNHRNGDSRRKQWGVAVCFQWKTIRGHQRIVLLQRTRKDSAAVGCCDFRSIDGRPKLDHQPRYSTRSESYNGILR